MTTSRSSQSKQLQYLLYRHAYTDALYYLGDDDGLREYTQTFYNNLPNRFETIHEKYLLKSIASTQLTLVGDFHTSKMAQQTFVDVLKLYIDHNTNREVVVALEMFSKKDTPVIKSYLRNKISEEELLIKTQYETTWGFAWENYSSILKICKHYGFDICCLDDPRLSLDKRESFLAKNIYSYLEKNREKKMFCLIGECHLADQHLPKKIQEQAHLSKPEHFIKPSYDTILQNIDKYHFIADQHLNQNKTTYLALSRKKYCILNTPVWKKWRSVERWYENQDYMIDDLSDEDVSL